jgi:hypothetical protein
LEPLSSCFSTITLLDRLSPFRRLTARACTLQTLRCQVHSCTRCCICSAIMIISSLRCQLFEYHGASCLPSPWSPNTIVRLLSQSSRSNLPVSFFQLHRNYATITKLLIQWICCSLRPATSLAQWHLKPKLVAQVFPGRLGVAPFSCHPVSLVVSR